MLACFIETEERQVAEYMIKLYYADISPLEEDDVFERYFGLLSEFRREKVDRFRFRKDKNLSVGAGLLLNAGLSKYGLTEMEMQYGTYENGKPFFVNYPQLHFNLSHSGSKVTAVFSDHEVGCDIEQINGQNLKLAKRFFRDSEYQSILCSAEPEQTFFRLWTLKESFMKVTGLGMKLPMNGFEIRIGDTVSVVQSVDTKQYSFTEPELYMGYKCAVCVAGDVGDFSAIEVTF